MRDIRSHHLQVSEGQQRVVRQVNRIATDLNRVLGGADNRRTDAHLRRLHLDGVFFRKRLHTLSYMSPHVVAEIAVVCLLNVINVLRHSTRERNNVDLVLVLKFGSQHQALGKRREFSPVKHLKQTGAKGVGHGLFLALVHAAAHFE